MSGLNSCAFIGNLGADPETRYTAAGDCVTNFRIAVNEKWKKDGETHERTEWVREYWEALHPYSAGGAYVNFLMDEGGQRVAASYRDNYGRLAKIKSKYDPGNLFRVNQNIKPNGSG